jgi:aminoglycoside phosphotransferase (APT) family kinase protein
MPAYSLLPDEENRAIPGKVSESNVCQPGDQQSMDDPGDAGTQEIADNLLIYMKQTLDDASLAYDGPVTRLLGGMDNTIYRFDVKGDHEELNRPLVLRLYPETRFPREAVVESWLQNALAKSGLPVPKAHFICEDKSILGGAFFIMDFVPGETLMTAPVAGMPEILARTQASLHGIDPGPMISALDELGVSPDDYNLNHRLKYLQHKAIQFPIIGDCVDWLQQHQPAEPARQAICHCDFHPLNILQLDGTVTGLLDWADLLIADPALDVANTIRLISIALKHASSSGIWGQELASTDWDDFLQRYLQEYREHQALDTTHLDYYGVLAIVFGLIPFLGDAGRPVEPLFGDDITELFTRDVNSFINRVTGIEFEPPN